MKWVCAFCLLLLLSVFSSLGAVQTVPLALHPGNSHYFMFRGAPTVLITSAEHYGALVNLDFDYKPYLAELAAHGLNNTRVFSGAYFEPQGAFNIARNTLAPAPERFIAPWPRAADNRFDLSKWNEAYFSRLHDLMIEASNRAVVVEIALFCPFYEDSQWKLSPMNAANNINGVGAVARTNVYTLDKHGGLLPIHEALTRKLVTELNRFDNLYFEICNEPYFGGVTMEWQHRMADVIIETEKSLPNKHLISMNVANGSKKIENPHPGVSVFNFHYANPPDAVAMNYHLQKPIGDNETGFRGTNNLVYRSEAWNFILAGGALYNNLDYSFTAGHERGDFAYPATQPGGGNRQFRKEISILKKFIEGFDFINMKPMNHAFKGELPAGRTLQMLATPGKAYGAYIGPKWEGKALAKTSETTLDFPLELPEGKYKAEWISTLTGEIRKAETFRHIKGVRSLRSPAFNEEIALRLLAE